MDNVINQIKLSVQAVLTSPVSESWSHSMENQVQLMLSLDYCNHKKLIFMLELKAIYKFCETSRSLQCYLKKFPIEFVEIFFLML